MRIGSLTATPIRFEYNSIEVGSWDATGFGFGTIAPNERVHVKDDTNDVALRIETDKVDGTAALFLENDNRAWSLQMSAADSFVINDITTPIFSMTKNLGTLVFSATTGVTQMNQAGIDHNLQVLGLTDDNLLFLDAGEDKVGIGTNTPLVKLDVVGNINATGNITSENVFLPQYIFSHTNQTIDLVSANVWANITISQEDSDISQGITHTFNDNTNQTFTIATSGVYNIDFDLDVEDSSVGASDIDVAGRLIYLNGTEIKGSVFETDITKQATEVELSHNFLVELMAGDSVIFQFVADDADVKISTHGTFGDHPESATILIYKIANLNS